MGEPRLISRWCICKGIPSSSRIPFSPCYTHRDLAPVLFEPHVPFRPSLLPLYSPFPRVEIAAVMVDGEGENGAAEHIWFVE
jgi:hypothetical protein